MPGGFAQGAQPQAQPAGRPGEVVVEEKPLKVTMGIELIKLLPAETASKPSKTASAAVSN